MNEEQKKKQLIFMEAANKYFNLMNLVVCSNCHNVVHDGNYCEQCGNKLIKVIVLKDEDFLNKKINKCVLCGEKAQLKIKDNVWICENCAQIQGELAIKSCPKYL